MTNAIHFPDMIRNLPAFDGAFDAYQLNATNCKVLFASYPAGTTIPVHNHDTNNCGVITQGELILTVNDIEQRYGVGEWYYLAALEDHAARFEVETSEIEFWFDVS